MRLWACACLRKCWAFQMLYVCPCLQLYGNIFLKCTLLTLFILLTPLYCVFQFSTDGEIVPPFLRDLYGLKPRISIPVNYLGEDDLTMAACGLDTWDALSIDLYVDKRREGGGGGFLKQNRKRVIYIYQKYWISTKGH